MYYRIVHSLNHVCRSVFVISLQPLVCLGRFHMTAACVCMDSTFSLSVFSVSSWTFIPTGQITSHLKNKVRRLGGVSISQLWRRSRMLWKVSLHLSAWLHGTWSCVVVVDPLEGVVAVSWGWAWEVVVVGGVSVNSPPCIKNRHAGAALCAVLTSPTQPTLTFPHSAGGCGSLRQLFLHFIQVRSDLLSLVKHWRSWPRCPPHCQPVSK